MSTTTSPAVLSAAIVVEVADVRHGHHGPVRFARFTANGMTHQASRYDDESQWRIDATFSASGLPFEVHGTGSRCCAKSLLADEVGAILDAAVA